LLKMKVFKSRGIYFSIYRRKGRLKILYILRFPFENKHFSG